MQPSGSDTAGAARKGRPTPSERLLVRLRAMGLPVPEDAEIQRTYAGYWQRKEGAWSWQVLPQRGGEGIGSQFSVAELLRTERLIAVHRYGGGPDWHVLPWDGKPAKYGEVLEAAPCPGSGQRWATGDHRPMCRVCHRRARWFGVQPRWRPGRGWSGTVPKHLPRTA